MPPKRVTRSENAAYQFFYYGLEIGKKNTPQHGLLLRPPDRVARVKRWPNTKWSDEKVIDFTGALYGGRAFACEVKEFEYKGDENARFEFSRIAPRQRSFLDHELASGTYPLLWIEFVVSEKRHNKDDVAFLIPWAKWKEVEATFTRQFKNGETAAWKSINLPWMLYFFRDFQLVYSRRNYWWTKAEAEAGYVPKKLGTS